MEQKWLLCDLHLHSQYSKINKPGDKNRVKEMSASEYVKIMSDNKIELFSITDHNYFSDIYYDQIEEYINNNNLNMKIINGAELDAFIELKDGKKGCIHICVYFDDNVDRKKIKYYNKFTLS